MDVVLLRPIRNLLGLRLVDVSRATGIRAERLSEAERGLARLESGELAAVRNFLRERLADDFGEAKPSSACLAVPHDPSKQRRSPSLEKWRPRLWYGGKMESTVCTSEVRPRQELNERLELFAAQCRLMAKRAEQGLPLDERSLDNLLRLSREFAESK
jgi:hypothetical protein